MMALRSKSLAAAAILAAAVVSCRSTRPTGTPVAPLAAASVEEAAAQLRERREAFRGMRSLMRVRATTNGKTQSFRAQLVVHDSRRMELIAYTPVGTTALTMKADGLAITSNPETPPESFAFFRNAGLTPAETAMLVLGLPPRDDVVVDVASMGLVTATVGDVRATFDPPAFPAKHVIVTRGADRVEIEHLETVGM